MAHFSYGSINDSTLPSRNFSGVPVFYTQQPKWVSAWLFSITE